MGDETIKDGLLAAHFIKDGIWRISENCQVNGYLVLGNEKALIIDTGYGIGGLPGLISRITALPVVAANTHDHADHALGNDAFDYVYCVPTDKFFDKADEDKLREYMRHAEPLTEIKSVPDYAKSHIGSHARKQDMEITDLMEIDLGARKLEAIFTPGHSTDSVCFLDRQSRVLFTGDTFVPSDYWGPAWLHTDASTPLLTFYNSLGRLLAVGGFEHLLPGHGECGLIPASRLATYLNGIKGIIDGKIVGRPEMTFVGPGLRCDWEGISLIYDPGNIA